MTFNPDCHLNWIHIQVAEPPKRIAQWASRFAVGPSVTGLRERQGSLPAQLHFLLDDVFTPL